MICFLINTYGFRSSTCQYDGYYRCMALMRKFGSPIKVDNRNSNELVQWDRYLRIQVEIDITKPFPLELLELILKVRKHGLIFITRDWQCFCYFYGVQSHEETK
uniref:Uncharacterized protein n=1 Tax=Nelumbo nucifera TaxID=4432 RepID=A0A822Z636_NELNU|nr:TPA_asm: hypothetical protein HUJ06_007629 [Nelumbo nucifera]